MLNSESRKYFRSAVPMSGVSTADTLYINGNHLCLAKILAKKHNQSDEIVNNIDGLVDFLQKIPRDDLINFSYDIIKFVPNFFESLWGPVIEGFYH